jgi:GTPase Era involved in 16S rRNA processing
MIGFTSRASSGLPEKVDALASAVDLAEGRLDEEAVAFGRHVVGKAGERLRHGTTNTLVALLGATGSGKSSVANAIVGSDVATTGVRRPTTSSTLACYWGSEDVQGLLDWLEIKNRHRVGEGSSELNGLVLLDVPDHDSVADAHREEMERIAEHADMLLWVTDAEKYADKAMHDYLARLSGHGAVTAMVLNKTDQLSEDDAERCRTDLGRLLSGAGLDSVTVLGVSALKGTGVDQLRELLAETVGQQQAMVDRLTADTTLAATELLQELGPAAGNADVPKKVEQKLVAELVDASGLTTVTDAVAAGHRRDAATKVGWPFTRWARRLRPHPLGRFHLGQGSTGRASLPTPSGVQVARVTGAVRDANRAASEGLAEPWPELLAEVGTPDEAALNDRIDVAVSEAARQSQTGDPRWWQVVNLLQIILALAVVAGVVWLGLLAFAAYLRIPEPPTPDYRGIPIPTGLLIGGLLLGLLVAFVASRLARVGGLRRARSVRQRAERAVGEVADELIIDPLKQELGRRTDLHQLLVTAGGTS